MPYQHVEFDLDVFEDEELIKELESRQYRVIGEHGFDDDKLVDEAIWRYKNGYIEDAALLLEQRFPELYGLHKRIKV